MFFLNWHLVSALPCSSQATLASSSLKRRIKESLALRATAFAVVEADLQEAAVASGAVSSTLLPRWLQSLTCCAYISKLYPKVSFHLDSVKPNIFWGRITKYSYIALQFEFEYRRIPWKIQSILYQQFILITLFEMGYVLSMVWYINVFGCIQNQ